MMADSMVPPVINQPRETATEKSGCQTQSSTSWPLGLILLIGILTRRRLSLN